ncbi:WLM domain-domain-containing protein, partial [Lobosporangium transversale]
MKVRPIMIAYGWKVGSLEEMTTENLYGLNFDHGKRILLRLRSNYDQTQFLPFGMIMDTMLHELAHNAHNGHGDSFYRTWDKLREEYYSL